MNNASFEGWLLLVIGGWGHDMAERYLRELEDAPGLEEVEDPDWYLSEDRAKEVLDGVLKGLYYISKKYGADGWDPWSILARARSCGKSIVRLMEFVDMQLPEWAADCIGDEVKAAVVVITRTLKDED